MFVVLFQQVGPPPTSMARIPIALGSLAFRNQCWRCVNRLGITKHRGQAGMEMDRNRYVPEGRTSGSKDKDLGVATAMH